MRAPWGTEALAMGCYDSATIMIIMMSFVRAFSRRDQSGKEGIKNVVLTVSGMS